MHNLSFYLTLNPILLSHPLGQRIIRSVLLPTNLLQTEEAKAEVEKKVSLLIKSILDKNKIPKVTKKELVGIVNDLHDQCQLLYSAFDVLGPCGRNASSSSSSSDLDYYSLEEIEISSRTVSCETWSLDYGVMLRKLQETELENGDLKRQVFNLKQETELREAIRQLSVVVDYQRCRYDDLKTSIVKVVVQA